MNILLHTCCAPCTLYPIKKLREENQTVTGFFYNPNIHPYQEYSLRLAAIKTLAEMKNLQMIIHDDYDLEGFLANVAAAPENRCSYCYASRIRKTAQTAAEGGFQGFSTSLLYSIYQKHDEIIDICRKSSKEFEVAFYYQDFRHGWQEGIRASKEMGLYRQQYCGCVYSEKERYCKKNKKKPV